APSGDGDNHIRSFSRSERCPHHFGCVEVESILRNRGQAIVRSAGARGTDGVVRRPRDELSRVTLAGKRPATGGAAPHCGWVAIAQTATETPRFFKSGHKQAIEQPW